MKTDIQAKTKGWAKVPHGIVDAAIPDMVKMVLWYCYDKPASWTFSVADVARSLGKTPQCIRRHFNTFKTAGVLKKVGEKHNKNGRYPIYSFAPAQVDAFVKSQLKVNPEMNPETDVETNPETNLETNPDIQGSHSKKDITRLNIEKDNIKTDNNENESTKEIDAKDLKNPFEDLDRYFKSQPSDPLMKPINAGPLSKIKSSLIGEQPPKLAAVAPEHPVNSAVTKAGVSVGILSMTVVPSTPATIIQSACGNSNANGTNTTNTGLASVPAHIIQPSVNGTVNTGAPGTNAGHPGISAQRASGTIAESGGVKGGIPKEAVDHVKWVLRTLKQSSPYTMESIAIIEREMLKELSTYNWKNYPIWSDPRQEVNTLMMKFVPKFGKFK